MPRILIPLRPILGVLQKIVIMDPVMQCTTLPSHSESFKRFLFHFSRRLNTLSIDFLTPKHPSETIVFHNEDGNPARANIKQALGYLKDGDGDGNSYAQDGDPSQDDVRLCLDDDLKKAQDHSQRQAGDLP
ncbi:hypothetical protein Tco_0223808 [Tanacetum coccineum]